MKVDIRTAQLPELVAAARAGEEVVIEEDGTEVARLVVAPPAADRPRFRLGSLSHLVGTAPDFPPIPDEEIDRWIREKEERIAAALAGRTG